MMKFRDRPTTIERAFELAASGAYYGITSLRKALNREGYGDARVQLDGHFIQKQLVAEMKRANPDGVRANVESIRTHPPIASPLQSGDELAGPL